MEAERPPFLSLVLGYGPALLLLAIGGVAWLAPAPLVIWVIDGGRIWAAAILLFLSGVRRGLSFFTDGGPRPAQVATSIGLFVLGLAAILLPLVPALIAATIGYAAVALLDPAAARRGEAPRHFARLRLPQMGIFVAGLGLLLARAI